HSVDRPMRTGWGIQPAESHVRQVRSDFPQIDAACLAVSKSGPGPVLEPSSFLAAAIICGNGPWQVTAEPGSGSSRCGALFDMCPPLRPGTAQVDADAHSQAGQ